MNPKPFPAPIQLHRFKDPTAHHLFWISGVQALYGDAQRNDAANHTLWPRLHEAAFYQMLDATQERLETCYNALYDLSLDEIKNLADENRIMKALLQDQGYVQSAAGDWYRLDQLLITG